MPLPQSLEEVIWTKRFWTEYFDLHPDDDKEWDHDHNVVCDVPVGDQYRLSLEFHLNYPGKGTLSFLSKTSEKVEIGRTGFHAFPHLLRWSELLAISRAAAAHDPSAFADPYLVALLLAPLAPICVGDDVNTVVSAVHSFLSRVGFKYQEIRLVLHLLDHRSADFRWRYDDVVRGWVIAQYRSYTDATWLYTHRRTNSKEFPFEEWPLLLSAAEEAIRGSTSSGDEPHHRAETPHYDLPQKHSLSLGTPIGTHPHPLFQDAAGVFAPPLNYMLLDLDMGTVHHDGTTISQHADGSTVQTGVEFTLGLRGGLRRCLGVVRQAAWWFGFPVEAYTQDMHFSPASRRYFLRDVEGPDDDGPEMYIALGKLGACFWRQGKPCAVAADENSCNALFISALEEAGAERREGEGWRLLRTGDGGELRARVVEGPRASRADICTVELRRVTPLLVRFLYGLLKRGELVVFPLLVAARGDVVQGAREKGEGDRYPPMGAVCVVSEEELLAMLEGGPYKWWCKEGGIGA